MKERKIITVLTFLLAALIIFVSCFGIFTPGFYSAESANWQAQSIGQDIIDLFIIAPLLLIAGVFVYRKSTTALLIWGGIIMFIVYTFMIYCFSVHFNSMFLLYCFILGLAVYSLCYFIYLSTRSIAGTPYVDKKTSVVTGIYFIILSTSFYCLWLADIIPSIINDTIPASLQESALITNPVHVIDLSVVLPAIYLTGIFLLKQKHLGLVLTPALLVFLVLMDITIGMLVIIMKLKGITANPAIAVIMGLLALFSLLLLFRYVKKKTA